MKDQRSNKTQISFDDMALMNDPSLAKDTVEYDEDGNPQLDIPSPDIQYEISERLSLEAAIRSLPPSDQTLIHLRYYQGKTQVETAEILHMTQVQISRREKKILGFIRGQMAV